MKYFFRDRSLKRIAFKTCALLSGILLAAGIAQADVFSNVPEAIDYEVAYKLAIPENGAFQGATLIPYSVNNSATFSPGGFDRVAYYLELTNASGTTWAYASMDAFTTLAAQAGLLHDITNPVSFQQSISNLSVFSNAAGVKTGSFERGQIEMWHPTYTAPNEVVSFAASETKNDRADTIGTIPSGYGSFLVHNPGSKQFTPRSTITNLATVLISGSESIGGFDKAVLKVLRNGAPCGADLEQTLDYSVCTPSSSFA